MDYKISTDGKRLLKVYANVKSLVIPKGVTTINSYAFINCWKLEYIEGPDITIIKDNVFYGCYHIKGINFPKVKKIGNDNFYNSKLKEVNLHKLIKLGNLSFEQCLSLKIINVPNLIEIGKDCFIKSRKLHTINSKLNKEQLIMAFSDDKEYNNYLQRNRVIKLKNLKNDL